MPSRFGLRDYGHTGQIGMEASPEEFVDKLVEVFREVRRVLREDGTCWVNMGDSYANDTKWGGSTSGKHVQAVHGNSGIGRGRHTTGLPGKNLIGVPWRLAFALQADGWILRQDIIWAKPNPMPESVRDRCTKAHEYIFLLSKSPTYYCDMGAIKEPVAPSTVQRLLQDVESQQGSFRVPGKTNGPMKAVGKGGKNAFRGQGHFREGENGPANRQGRDMQDVGAGDDRNKRSVWTISTKPYKGAHFATFPPGLIEPCILAGAPAGGVVLDPFFGSGTSGEVAQRLGRAWIGCELNPDYKPLQDQRLRQPGLVLEEAA